MISLRQMRYFCALARHRHFGRAAEECAVSQPALSVQIQEMESLLGVALVERTRGLVTLTPAGLEIERRAGTILSDTRDLMDYARHRDTILTGTLRLGIIPSIAPYLLPATLPLLQDRFPHLDLQLRETMTQALLDELDGGNLDVVLLSLPIEQPGVETLALFDDRFLLATAAAADGRADARVSPATLARHNLLLLEEGHCMRDQALTFCRAINPAVRNQFGATSLATIIQMVANGYGVTLLPEISVAAELRNDPRIRLVRFTDPEPSRAVGLAWRRSSTRKADFAALGEVVALAAAGVLRA